MEEKLIYPENMMFFFKLSTKDCYRRFTGKCSLDEDEKIHIEQENQCYCGKWHYCRDLHLAVLSGKVDGKEQGDNVRIREYSCGHYTITGGQHRLCLAKRKKLPIFAEVSEPSLAECPVCSEKRKKKSIINTIKQNFKKSKTDSDTFIF